MAKNEYHIMAARLTDFVMAPVDVSRELYQLERASGVQPLAAAVKTVATQLALFTSSAAIGGLTGMVHANASGQPLAGAFSAAVITGLGYTGVNRLAGTVMPTMASGPRERTARLERTFG